MFDTKLSIVIPVLDEAERIGGHLAALRTLRAEGVEVVVVDGGSSDGTLACAATLADQAIVARRGRARQMNAGAAAARGSVLLFLHADTALPQGACRAIAAAIEGGAQWGRFDVRIAGRHFMLRLVAAMMNWRSRLTGIATGDQAIFIRREAFDAVGGYPDIPLMEDIRLSALLRRRSPPACLRLRVTTSGRRWDTHGILRTVLTMWCLRLAFFFGVSPDRLARRYGYKPLP